MAAFPLHLESLFGAAGTYLIYLLIGFGFGYALEIGGFGNSAKLAAQFYFKDMTVLKVMFTGIVVAMVLIFGASALGLLDINLIWVNPTYLWPGIVGGLIMGVGFIVGGYCPGTSLVGLSTFKVDALFYVLGASLGILLFGETVDKFSIFWTSSYLGRFMLPELFGVPTGYAVLGVVLMALFMFWGSEQLEKIFGGIDPSQAPRVRYLGAGLLVLAALAVMLIGQPTTADRWAKIESQKQALLDDRAVQIEPGELLHTMHDHMLNLVMLDLRSEADYNLFHLEDALNVSLEELPAMIPDLLLEPPASVIILMSNDETRATEAWKLLVAESVPTVYILEGGINRWIAIFAAEDARIRPGGSPAEDALHYDFSAALGDAYPASWPDPEHYPLEFSTKIKLQLKRGPMGGGCG